MASAHPPHSHVHAHGPGHAQHAHDSSRERRALWIALVVTAGFAVVEAIGGWLAGSLALLSDAGHMVTDVAALAIALIAQRLARRPPSFDASYGYSRAEVLAAFINALVMLVVVAWIAIEAVRRLLAPTPVAGGVVLVVAAFGLAVNVFSAWLLSHGHTLNSRSALLHVMGDLLGSVAAIVAGAVVVATGWTPIDPILSIAVSVLVLRSTWVLLTASTRVLMEAVPSHLSYEEIGRALSQVSGVVAIHDLHVWHMSSERAALSAHLVIRDPGQWPDLLARAQRLLAQRFGIDHVTLQPSWHAQPAGRRVIPVTVLPSDDNPRLH